MNSAHYDFETLIDRTGTGSYKWESMREANPCVPDGTVPVSVADLDLPLAPEIRDGLIDYLNNGVLGYTHPHDGFLTAIQGWCERRHDWAIQSEWIAPVPGVVTGMYASIRAASAPGDGIILMTPAYPPMFDAIGGTGRRLRDVPLVLEDGRYSIDMDQVARAAREEGTTALLLCSPHNPTGRVWTRAELEALAAIAREHNLTVISDDIHWDLVHDGHTHIPFPTLGEDAAARTIVLSAPSKTFNIPGLVTSYALISNPDLRARFTAELAAWGFHFLPSIGITATDIAYTSGGGWLDAFLDFVAHNDRMSRAFFAAHFPEVVIPPLEGTYLQWLDFRALGHTPAELARIHREDACAFFDDGARFGAPGFERLNLGTPTRSLEAILERLRRAHGR